MIQWRIYWGEALDDDPPLLERKFFLTKMTLFELKTKKKFWGGAQHSAQTPAPMGGDTPSTQRTLTVPQTSHIRHLPSLPFSQNPKYATGVITQSPILAIPEHFRDES